MDKQAKTTFLRSKPWKEFRQVLFKLRGPTCELCGQRYYGKSMKNLHVHHLKPVEYDNLDPDRFSILCKSCHKTVHRILRRYSNKKNPLTNKELWVPLLQSILR